MDLDKQIEEQKIKKQQEKAEVFIKEYTKLCIKHKFIHTPKLNFTPQNIYPSTELLPLSDEQVGELKESLK